MMSHPAAVVSKRAVADRGVFEYGPGSGVAGSERAALSEYWFYRELFFFLVWREVKVRYKQTILGVLWAAIQPLFTMIIFTLLFGRVANLPSDGMPYPIFYYSALVPWTYFANAVTNSGNSLVNNAQLLTKVYFPRFMLPASSVLSGLVDFGFAFVLLLGMMVIYGVGFSWEFLLWPLLVLPVAGLALGVGLLSSALNVNYRDVKYTIPFVVQLWMFISPVVYPTSMIPEKYRFLVSLNPVTGMIEAFRAATVPDRFIDWSALALSMVTTLVVLIVGYLYFRRTEREFADVV
jgi:homopolymeric O-antigen transport system permease protein